MKTDPVFTNQCYRRSVCMGLVSLLVSLSFLASPTLAGDTVLDLWKTVKAPEPVTLKSISIDSSKAAFLVLDIEQRTCNEQARPRCVDSAPKIKAFLGKCRARGVFVIYSLTNQGTPETILPHVTPRGTDPIVKSSVDKFYNTDLEKILKEKGIETVIIAGTAAEGAVLHTATGASMRGFKVIVPIDGMSSATLYAEQYTAWHLLNAPGTRLNATLTRFDLIDLN